jgi:hypothetical protein
MFTRLARAQPWKAQIGCAFGIALVAAAPGIFIGYMTYVHDHSDNRTAILAFSAVWIAVALLVLLGGIHQLFAVRSPETIVEIEPAELTPGSPVRIRVTQPGPLRLVSLHANLAGEQIKYFYARGVAGEGSKRTSTTRYMGPYRMLEVERKTIDLSERLQREADFIVPAIDPSLESTDLKIRWKIEVWGRVSMWPNFMHPFPVTVAGSAKDAESA